MDAGLEPSLLAQLSDPSVLKVALEDQLFAARPLWVLGHDRPVSCNGRESMSVEQFSFSIVFRSVFRSVFYSFSCS